MIIETPGTSVPRRRQSRATIVSLPAASRWPALDGVAVSPTIPAFDARVLRFPTFGAPFNVSIAGRRCRMILDPSEPETAFSLNLGGLVQRTGRTLWLEVEGRCADEAVATIERDGRSAHLRGLLWPLQGCDVVVGRRALTGGLGPETRDRDLLLKVRR